MKIQFQHAPTAAQIIVHAEECPSIHGGLWCVLDGLPRLVILDVQDGRRVCRSTSYSATDEWLDIDLWDDGSCCWRRCDETGAPVGHWSTAILELSKGVESALAENERMRCIISDMTDHAADAGNMVGGER